MKELDSFTVEQLNNFIESDHAQCGDVAALARIALAAKRGKYGAEMVTRFSFNKVCSEARTWRERALKAEEVPEGWIKCSDRMPEINDWVTGWHIEGYQRIVSWQKSYGNYLTRSASHCWQGDNDDVELEGTITHWMPLPAPPEKENG